MYFLLCQSSKVWKWSSKLNNLALAMLPYQHLNTYTNQVYPPKKTKSTVRLKYEARPVGPFIISSLITAALGLLLPDNSYVWSP